jgi:cephalosporin hydroxylase
MSKIEEFFKEREAATAAMGKDEDLRAKTHAWFDHSARHGYSYNFTWMGRPIIQYPQDMIAMQEIIWRVKPDAIVETGIAHGGSLVFYASLLELLGGDREIVGIDIDIRPHNRAAIEAHPMMKRIHMIQGSSIDDGIAQTVRDRVKGRSNVLVILDSNHTHEHVLRELQLYAPLVKKGSYVIVFDTVVEHMQPDAFPNRPWGRGNNPMTAVDQFLKSTSRFEIDRAMDDKLLISVAPRGYLRCVAD